MPRILKLTCIRGGISVEIVIDTVSAHHYVTSSSTCLAISNLVSFESDSQASITSRRSRGIFWNCTHTAHFFCRELSGFCAETVDLGALAGWVRFAEWLELSDSVWLLNGICSGSVCLNELPSNSFESRRLHHQSTASKSLPEWEMASSPSPSFSSVDNVRLLVPYPHSNTDLLCDGMIGIKCYQIGQTVFQILPFSHFQPDC